MKIIIPGGTGQVGTLLARALHQAKHQVVVLSRTPQNQAWPVIVWDAENLGSWVQEIEGADVVINLAGKNVNCRYSPANRQQIKASRVKSTRVLGEAIAQVTQPPSVWLQASTATIYAHSFDRNNDEFSGRIGGTEPDAPAKWRFSIDVAQSWEREAQEAVTPQTRKVFLRSAMIMDPNPGGIFDVLLRLVRFGLGGKAGNGKQYVSWIHDQDFVQAVLWLIQHEEMAGPVNLASPNPLPYSGFMRTLRSAWGMPIGLPATRLMLEVGAVFLRTETELVLKSRRVVPGRLLESGFSFTYPAWEQAARDLCQRWRAMKIRGRIPIDESR